jgi:hypothetical protein
MGAAIAVVALGIRAVVYAVALAVAGVAGAAKSVEKISTPSHITKTVDTNAANQGVEENELGPMPGEGAQ